jgi:hypothetical protein
LYARYEYWAKENGVEPIIRQWFGRRLAEKGYQAEKGTAGKRFWLGIGLHGPSEASSP